MQNINEAAFKLFSEQHLQDDWSAEYEQFINRNKGAGDREGVEDREAEESNDASDEISVEPNPNQIQPEQNPRITVIADFILDRTQGAPPA